jgi:methylglyoxal/glyoxal reductase
MVSEIDSQEKVILNNGVSMPMLGLGVYGMHGDQAVDCATEALKIGFRMIDTAAMYRNEREIGKALKRSGLDRREVFVTTKVDNQDQGYDATLRAFDASLKEIESDFVDLYLIHWPVKTKRKQTWKALEKIYFDKRTRAIGVANYLLPFLREMEEYAGVVPAVNQVEFSPFLLQESLLEFCQTKKIQLQAYSPLVRGRKLKDPKLVEIAKKYHKSPAQIILRWDIQMGVSPIPKSSNPQRLRENFEIFDFTLSCEDVERMKKFDENFRLVGDPMSFW